VNECKPLAAGGGRLACGGSGAGDGTWSTRGGRPHGGVAWGGGGFRRAGSSTCYRRQRGGRRGWGRKQRRGQRRRRPGRRGRRRRTRGGRGQGGRGWGLGAGRRWGRGCCSRRLYIQRLRPCHRHRHGCLRSVNQVPATAPPRTRQPPHRRRCRRRLQPTFPFPFRNPRPTPDAECRGLGQPLHAAAVPGRGLHSSTFRLNLSALCGIGGASEGCLGVVQGVLEGIRGHEGRILCEKRLRLS